MLYSLSYRKSLHHHLLCSAISQIKDRTIHYARMTCVLYVMFAHTVTGTHCHEERDPGAGECRSLPLRRPTVSNIGCHGMPVVVVPHCEPST